MFNLERKDGLRMWPGASFMLTLDRRQPGAAGGKLGVYADGPVTGVVRISDARGALPEGTLLSGYLWTSGEVAVGRYTEAQLPDGRTLPVCVVLGRKGYVEKWPDSKPGAAQLNRTIGAYAVERWP
jgi:serine/threonine-protein kinase